jgi:curved DNA-binding protein CbpA
VRRGAERFDLDYYRVLGVGAEASADEVRRAYRRLALEWHPDRNHQPEAAERFKQISEAYAVLIDPAKRRHYDRLRHRGAPGDFSPSREDLFRDLFADPQASAIFEELAREFQRLGLRVDRHAFHQTLFGGRAVISGGVVMVTPATAVLALARLARALLRGASGAAAVAPPVRPRGLLQRLLGIGRRALGAPTTGTGADVTFPLRVTRAEAERGAHRRLVLGREDARSEVLVRIPGGVRSGTRLRLRGKGRRLPDGRLGDAYLLVEVEE